MSAILALTLVPLESSFTLFSNQGVTNLPCLLIASSSDSTIARSTAS
uniref:Uncharacterized protein n=1 Tax=Phakopsora pachyrhizi TaxID=170000 RepID=A0A0S1MK12_PHAPC